MVCTTPHYTVLALAFSLFVLTRAHAQAEHAGQEAAEEAGDEAAESEATAADPKQKAARLFDRAVRRFARGKYGEAARLFLEADATFPNSEALSNAINASLRAREPLLTVRAAETAIARTDVDPRIVQSAYAALAKVTPELARLELACVPEEDCQIQVDGAPETRGILYVLPGRHQVVGETTARAQVVQHVDCPASAVCRVVLEPAVQTAQVSAPAGPIDPASAARAESQDSKAPRAIERDGTRHSSTPRWLPLSALVGSATGAAAFVALTTWSGFDALAARRLHKDDPAAYDPSDVKRRARRTDILLAGSVLFAGATAASCFWWLRWKKSQRATLSLTPGQGLALVAEGQF